MRHEFVGDLWWFKEKEERIKSQRKILKIDLVQTDEGETNSPWETNHKFTNVHKKTYLKCWALAPKLSWKKKNLTAKLRSRGTWIFIKEFFILFCITSPSHHCVWKAKFGFYMKYLHIVTAYLWQWPCEYVRAGFAIFCSSFSIKF